MTYHISLVNVQNNYCNNNLLILDVKQLNKIMKLYYFYTLKALWDGQGKIKMYLWDVQGWKAAFGKKFYWNISKTEFIGRWNKVKIIIDIKFEFKTIWKKENEKERGQCIHCCGTSKVVYHIKLYISNTNIVALFWKLNTITLGCSFYI